MSITISFGFLSTRTAITKHRENRNPLHHLISYSRHTIRQYWPNVGVCLWSHSTPDVFLWSNIWKTARIISTRPHLIYRPSCECLHSFWERRSERQRVVLNGTRWKRPAVMSFFGEIKKNTYFKNYDLPTKNNTCLWCSFSAVKYVCTINKNVNGSVLCVRRWTLINKGRRVKLEQSELRRRRKMKLFLVRIE